MEDEALWLCSEVSRLYQEDSFTHFYLLYDLLYESSNTELFYIRKHGKLTGYVLTWHNPRMTGVHVWGEFSEIIEKTDFKRNCRGKCIIQVYNVDLLEEITGKLNALSMDNSVSWFLDMVVDEQTFKPYLKVRATRLDPSNPRDIEEFVKLKGIQGRDVSSEKAAQVIIKHRYYGIFMDNKLVSISGCYVRTRDVWGIGDVYTHPKYRGKGYAKAVTSAITSDALKSGAKAILHVKENNESAIKVYKSLGYKVLRKKPWIFVDK